MKDKDLKTRIHNEIAEVGFWDQKDYKEKVEKVTEIVLSLFKECTEEVIGQNEKPEVIGKFSKEESTTGKSGTLIQGLTNNQEVRNQLRAQQREKSKELVS